MKGFSPLDCSSPARASVGKPACTTVIKNHDLERLCDMLHIIIIARKSFSIDMIPLMKQVQLLPRLAAVQHRCSASRLEHYGCCRPEQDPEVNNHDMRCIPPATREVEAEGRLQGCVHKTQTQCHSQDKPCVKTLDSANSSKTNA